MESRDETATAGEHEKNAPDRGSGEQERTRGFKVVSRSARGSARTGAASAARPARGGGRRPLQPTRRGSVVVMTSTEAQNGFGRVLDTVARDGTVLIKKHNTTQAVVISVDRYEALTQASAPALDTLTTEFDELLARMQTSQARAAMRDAFGASPDELGRSAVEAARRRGG
jgi:antitoxin Phd